MSDTVDNPRAVLGGNAPPIAERLALDHADLATAIAALAERANAAPKTIAGEDDLLAIGKIVKDAREVTGRAEGARVDEKEPFLTAGREVDAFFATMKDRLSRITTALQDRADAYQREKAAEERRKQAEAARKAREEEDRQREIAERAAAAGRNAAAAKAQAAADARAEEAAKAEAEAKARAADMTRVRGGGTTVSARTVWTFQITDYEAIPLDRLRPYLKREAVEAAIGSLVKVQKNASPLAGVRIFEETKANFR